MKNIKKVLLYSPYLHILGGGERHILSILQVFEKCGYQIDIVCDDDEVLKKIHQRLNMKFKHARIIPNFFLRSSVVGKLLKTRKYEHLFYVTDGSYFLSRARNNYIFAMYPQVELYNMKFINRLKLFNFSIVSNGSFTAEYIDRWFGKKPAVIHPYIDDAFLKKDHSHKKETILSVGRFYDHLHAKRQDILIEAFKALRKKHKEFSDYTLILAGGADEADRLSLNALYAKIGHDPHIRLVVNPTFESLLSLYNDARIYWHAAGYGIDEKKEPYKVEHLGITPLEAMASRCTVFAHNSGGPKRLIDEGENGFTYDTVNELVEKTAQFVKKDNSEVARNAQAFIIDRFSFKVFEKEVRKYFKI